jgi:hypothetical protein
MTVSTHKALPDEDGLEVESEPTEKAAPRRGRTAAVAAAVVFLAAGAAVGGYFLADSTGADLDAARAEGAVAGKKAGTVQGVRAGYSDGLRQGKEQGYESTYAGAYRDAYARAYEAADLTPPKKIEVRQ